MTGNNLQQLKFIVGEKNKSTTLYGLNVSSKSFAKYKSNLA